MSERARERECRKGLLMSQGSHSSLSPTHTLITYTQREQQQQEEPQQTYKYKCTTTTTKLTTRLATGTGTGRRERGRKSKTGRESLALLLPWPSSSTCALCSTPVQISFKFWQIKPWFCYLRANERERTSKRVRPMSIEWSVEWGGMEWCGVGFPRPLFTLWI